MSLKNIFTKQPGVKSIPLIDMQQLIEDIKGDEGTVLHCYKDSLGFDTIGTGILIDARGGGITMAENEMLLENRLHITITGLDDKIPWLMTKSDNIQRQLVNMAYELGVDGLLKFPKMLELIRVGNYNAAADEGLNSDWAKEVPNRSKRVTDNIRKG